MINWIETFLKINLKDQICAEWNRNSKINCIKKNCKPNNSLKFNAKPNTVQQATTQPRFNVTISQFPRCILLQGKQSVEHVSLEWNFAARRYEKEEEKDAYNRSRGFESSARFTAETPSSDTSVATNRNYGLQRQK